MKKSFLSLVFFLTACHLTPLYDTEFKNPIFYQTLRPLSKTVGYVYLTPTSIKLSELFNKDKIDYIGKCDLIENGQNRITLKCTGEWSDGSLYNSYFTYITTKVLELVPNCLRIVEYTYDKPEEFPKDEIFAAKYCVTPLGYTESESD